MTPGQLQKTRAERWRQNGNALVTLEDAEEWLQPLGLCLFVPRRVQLPTPAPSFVEACLGEPNFTPPLAAVENATALLTRLVDKGSVVPLNLLGISGEQPDFLATAEALPFVFALRGDKDWKHEPQTAGNGRVSPLVLGIWKALERTGVQTAVEIREAMGKELTEAAILRGLSELWNAMRVIMLPGEGGEAATWELLKSRYQRQMAAGAAMSQVSALSVLLAQYLESAVGATSEEAEIFLSPLSSRSKVRDVVRGLTATRQLAMIGLDGQAVLYVEGTLPEFDAPQSEVTIEAAGPDTEIATSNAPAAKLLKISKIRKFTKRPPTAPGEADPLRWKRDSSVPPPAGQSRDGSREARPESQGFDRRSAPKAPGEFAARPASGARPERPRLHRPDPETKDARIDGPRSDRPRSDRFGSDRSGSTPKFGRPSRPFSKPAREQDRGFAAKPGNSAGKTDRPSFTATSGSRESGGRTFGRGAPQNQSLGAGSKYGGRGPGSFEKRPRWVPREGASSPGHNDRSDGKAGRDKRDAPAAGNTRPYSRPAAGGFRARAGGTGPNRPPSDRASFSRPSGDRSSSGRPPSSGQGSGSGSFPREDNRASPGGPRQFDKTGTSGFKPRTERPRSDRPSEASYSPRPSSARPSSGRPAKARPAGPGGFQKKPRWVPREGSSSKRPTRPHFGRPSGDRTSQGKPGDPDKPSYTKRPPFGARAGGGRPSSGVGRPAPGAGGTGGERPAGRSGFSRKPGGKPAFGRKRPGPGSGGSGSSGPGSGSPGSGNPRPKGPRSRGPGDYPKRKRPE